MPLSSSARQFITGITNKFRKEKETQNLAKKEMDDKYPNGWASSPTNMVELNLIKKRISKTGK